MDGGCRWAQALAGYALQRPGARRGAASGSVHRSLGGEDGTRGCGGGGFSGVEGGGNSIGAGVQELGGRWKRINGAHVSAVDLGCEEEHQTRQRVLRAG